MVAKLVFSKWQATLMAPVTFIYNLAMLFLFRLFIPGFKEAYFPALLVFYLMFSLSISLEMQNSAGISRLHLPVTARQVVAANFLFQATIVLFAWLVATLFVTLSPRGTFVPGIIPKASLVALLLSGITTGIGNLLPPKGYQLMSMLVFIALIFVTISGGDANFLPWLSLPVALGASLGGFTLAMALSLLCPPRFV